VQFLEATDLGVRSAVYRLAQSGDPAEFILFPMSLSAHCGIA
jgi:hypothetical protein